MATFVATSSTPRALTSSPWGRLLAVVWAPRATALAAVADGRGFGTLVALLAVEFLLVHAAPVAAMVVRAPYAPVASITGVWSMFLGDALGPALAVFVVGVAAYYLLRAFGRHFDVWSVASALAPGWVAHTWMVGLGVIVAAAGFDHEVLPQHSLDRAAMPWPWVLLKVLVAYLPSAWLMIAAFLGLRQVNAAGGDVVPGVVVGAPRWVRRTVTVGLCSVLVASAVMSAWGVVARWEQTRPLLPGDEVPAFVLQHLDGGRRASHELAGNVLLIDFWATWCPPCVAAMPELERMHRDYGPRGLSLVSINVEARQQATVRAFVQQQGLSFPVYVDAGELQRRFSVTSFPTMFVVDRSGTLREFEVGVVGGDRLRRIVEPLLSP